MAARDELRRRGTKPPPKAYDDGKFYAELIFDAKTFKRNLPYAIEAVFYMRADWDCGDVGDGSNHMQACEGYARKAHAAMLKHFGLVAHELPLLYLDLWDWKRPFKPDAEGIAHLAEMG